MLSKSVLTYQGPLSFSTIDSLLSDFKLAALDHEIPFKSYKKMIYIMIEALENITKYSDQFVCDFVAVFNETWASFKENFKPLEVSYTLKSLKKAKSILEEEFLWIAYHKGKPIAIYLMYPDVNMILKHLNGRLTLPALIKFLYLKRKKTITRARGVLMGVLPAFQGLGVEAGIIINLVNVFKTKPHYTEIEFSWVGDFNPKMRKIFMSVGSVSAKHYITYRYLFDRDKEFVRFPIPED